MSKIPKFLTSRLAVVAVLAGIGGGGAYIANKPTPDAEKDKYVQAVASDDDTSDAVKIAMVLGQFYESSGRHIGTPYIDNLGKGKPLTVCNGITGEGVVLGKYYTEQDCYFLERTRYVAAEKEMKHLFKHWDSYNAFVQGTLLDFAHNKGISAIKSSTLLKKANAGDLAGACRENLRWNKGTVNGVQTVLPGLKLRADSNTEICLAGVTEK